MDKTKREDTKMPQNPLAGLSRYINVDYREPDESVVDSIFGTYAERMDRDITKANLQLERDKLKYNADLDQQKYNQGRIDKARQNLMDDIIGTRGAMKGLPAYQIDAAVQKIIPMYSDILGVDESNKVYESSHTDGVDMGEDYIAASKNNYEIIQTLDRAGEITTAKGLVDLDNKFVFSADQGGAYNSARNKRAKEVLISDRDISLAWDEAFENHDSYDKAYPRKLIEKEQIEKELGIHKTSTDQNRLDKQTALLKLEKVDSIEETTKWKEYQDVIAWTKEATQVRRAFKRYQENPWLFIKETYKEPEANAVLEHLTPEQLANNPLFQTGSGSDIVNGALGVVNNLSSSIQTTPLDTTSVDSVVNVLENIPAYGDDFSSYQESMPQYGADAMKLSDFVRGPDTEDPFVRTNILNEVSEIEAGNKTTDDVVNQQLESLTLTSSGEDSLSYDFNEASVDGLSGNVPVVETPETNFKDILPSYLTDKDITSDKTYWEKIGREEMMQKGDKFNLDFLSKGEPKSYRGATKDSEFFKEAVSKLPTVEEILNSKESFSPDDSRRHKLNMLADFQRVFDMELGGAEDSQLMQQVQELHNTFGYRYNEALEYVQKNWKWDKDLQMHVRPKGT